MFHHILKEGLVFDEEVIAVVSGKSNHMSHPGHIRFPIIGCEVLHCPFEKLFRLVKRSKVVSVQR